MRYNMSVQCWDVGPCACRLWPHWPAKEKLIWGPAQGNSLESFAMESLARHSCQVYGQRILNNCPYLVLGSFHLHLGQYCLPAFGSRSVFLLTSRVAVSMQTPQ